MTNMLGILEFGHKHQQLLTKSPTTWPVADSKGKKRPWLTDATRVPEGTGTMKKQLWEVPYREVLDLG